VGSGLFNSHPNEVSWHTDESDGADDVSLRDEYGEKGEVFVHHLAQMGPVAKGDVSVPATDPSRLTLDEGNVAKVTRNAVTQLEFMPLNTSGAICIAAADKSGHVRPCHSLCKMIYCWLFLYHVGSECILYYAICGIVFGASACADVLCACCAAQRCCRAEHARCVRPWTLDDQCPICSLAYGFKILSRLLQQSI
jgi:hypothetical protein